MTAREFQRKLTAGWRQHSLGALLAVVAGLFFLWSRLGQSLDHASYDWLFWFGSRPAPAEVIIIRLNEAAHQELKQPHGQMWDRGLHADLVNRLAQAKLVVFDVFLTEPGDTVTNRYFADALQKHGKVVLAGELIEDPKPGIASVWKPLPPLDVFQAAGQWGIAHLEQDTDSVIRRHYGERRFFRAWLGLRQRWCKRP